MIDEEALLCVFMLREATARAVYHLTSFRDNANKFLMLISETILLFREDGTELKPGETSVVVMRLLSGELAIL